MQILLVEQDSQRSERWQKRLESEQAVVIAAPTPLEATKVLNDSHFTLAICGLPSKDSDLGGSAEDFVQHLLHSCYSVICLTAEGDKASQQRAYTAGFHDCLTEECSDAELKAKIEHASNQEGLHNRLAQAQKLESIGELAAGIAHEINTPIQYVGDNTRFVQSACEDITSILEVCQKLVAIAGGEEELTRATASLQATMDDADVEYLIDEIPTAIKQSLEGVDRVANIVRAMKEFAHPGISEMTPTDLGKAIENTAMVARNEWKYVANLETELDPNLPLVPCLPGELNQVLLNMIVNAAHAIADALGVSPDKKGCIRITTRLAKPHAEIRITDSGSGIAKENIEKIFAPFFTTKAAGKGTGQGLAIAHSVIVEKHNGTIHVESEVGKGTVFVIRIPLEVAKQSSETSAQQPELATVSSGGKQ